MFRNYVPMIEIVAYVLLYHFVSPYLAVGLFAWNAVVWIRHSFPKFYVSTKKRWLSGHAPNAPTE
jgi:hypothetical protein